jgi:cysteine desulfurase
VYVDNRFMAAYLDYNATTPVDPRVLVELLPYLSSYFGNPSSDHVYGRTARSAVDLARQKVATLLGADPSEVTFTGSGSESNALAIRGAVLANVRAGRDTIVTQVTEHPSVLANCLALQRRHGYRVVRLPVDQFGRVDPAQVGEAVDDSTVLVTIQLANGETGTVQQIAEIADIAHARGAMMHTDAAQAAGKTPVAVHDLGTDLLTIAGHKMYAPKGVAALYHRAGTALEPLVDGGGQERGVRSGTENVAFIVALGVACDLAGQDLVGEAERLRLLRDQLHNELRRRLGDGVRLNGHPTERLANTLNISVDRIDARAVLAATPDIAASTGSACHAGSLEPSAVLLAMGLSPARAGAALRLTLGRWTVEAEVSAAAEALARTIHNDSALA